MSRLEHGEKMKNTKSTRAMQYMVKWLISVQLRLQRRGMKE